MFSTTCNGVPSRGVTTTSKSVTVDNLRAGIQYSVSVTGRNNFALLTDTVTTNVTTKELGKINLLT